ncbi:GNAT family N-acetyltransferase [Flavobacterium beibuense]|uniref:Acetyltransferase, GNAT family n=1 Tax=Flavobacterium beibuense TaxID=657326 RepID=A0A444W607_9FLAO|nr:GNAT family N-acetyltransferase [Flavobacterium beibuense]RYJ41156.1 Acetyltransferase, GNAT family [Flavobacterium beibuense]
MYRIRLYKQEDCNEVVSLFYNTVHSVNKKDYTTEQLDAWAPADLDFERWNRILSQNYTIIVEKEGVIKGFGDIDATGYFDHLFVHKDHQGQGIATLIKEKIEKHALDANMQRVTVAASITARPFFEKHGYTVLKEQRVERNGQTLINYFMEKFL